MHYYYTPDEIYNFFIGKEWVKPSEIQHRMSGQHEEICTNVKCNCMLLLGLTKYHTMKKYG